jgi:hypothetical protein
MKVLLYMCIASILEEGVIPKFGVGVLKIWEGVSDFEAGGKCF